MDMLHLITKGYAIEIMNPETGRVEWLIDEDGKKFTYTKLITVLTVHFGWSYGDSLLLRKNGDLFELMDENHSPFAIIGKKLAGSLRNMPNAKFVYKH